jgi:chemotaxis signal transduction protein
LAVESVVGIVNLSDSAFGNLPALLQSGKTEFIRALGTLDREFLVTLNTALMVPESVWLELAQTGSRQ